MARTSLAILTVFLIGEPALPDWAAADERPMPGPVQTKTVVTDFLNIDRIYASMVGPMNTVTFKFGKHPENEMIWLTGARIETFDRQNKPLADVYLCHTNLDVRSNNSTTHRHDHAMASAHQSNFMDLVQGQPGIHFPPGFGLPLITDDWVVMHAMALNSHPVEKPFDIFFKATLEYIYDHDLKEPLKSLRLALSNVFVPARHPNCPPPMAGKPQFECGVYRADTSGKEMNLHWLVPPGRHTYRHKLKEGLGIHYDTTAHFISMHLHNHAESMELIDLTAQKTVFKGKVSYYPNSRDIDRFEYYSDEEGIPLFIDHEYELTAVYNNTTDEDIDAMAVLYIYYWDKEFNQNTVSAGHSH
jgi:hypothetical protein